MENALSHLLLAAFAFVYLEARESGFALRRLTFVAALCMTNRLDLGLLFLPALAFETARAPSGWRTTAAHIAVGLSPLTAWELFSIVYYGFPFPNTAYAKLNTGISARELLRHGLGYIASHADNDPLTLVAIVAGLVFGIASRDSKLRVLAAGVTIYLLYLLRIGGDFMLGRFLTPPLLMATILIGRCQLLRTRALVSIPFAAAVLALGVWAPRTPLRAPLQPKPSVDVHGVADERLIYALHSSLAARRGNAAMPDHYWRTRDARFAAPAATPCWSGPTLASWDTSRDRWSTSSTRTRSRIRCWHDCRLRPESGESDTSRAPSQTATLKPWRLEVTRSPIRVSLDYMSSWRS